MQIMARELSAAIAACATVADANSKIPILRTTRIAIDGGFASMIATNTEQTITVRAACAGSGVTCIDTGLLSAKIMTLRPNEPVVFEGDGKFVAISQGRTKWRVPVLLDDFPLPTPVDGEPVKLGKDFIAALNQAFSVIDPGGPSFISGAFIGGKTVMATNGKTARIIEFDGNLPRDTIIPARVVGRVTAMFPDGATVTTSENAATFSTEFVTLKTRLVEGIFPDIRRVISSFDQSLVNTFTVDADEFSGVIMRASAIGKSGEKSGAFINMQLRIRADEIEIATRNLNGEEGSDFCRCERTGEDADIGIKGDDLVLAVQSMPSDTYQVRYGGKENPFVMSPLGSTRENIRVIQPRIFS